MSFLSPTYRVIENNLNTLIFDSYYKKSIYEYGMYIFITIITFTYAISLKIIYLIIGTIFLFLLLSFLTFKYARWIIHKEGTTVIIQSFFLGMNYNKNKINKNTIISIYSKKYPHGIGYWYLTNNILYIRTNAKKFKIFNHTNLEKIATLKEMILNHI